jgi:hypothetical protein
VSREHEVRVPDRFWRHSTKISTDAKSLYSILLTFIDYVTNETYVSNLRLQRESGFGAVKVKGLLAELQAGNYIERSHRYVCNLRSKRTIRCLKFVSTVQIPYSRPEGMVFDRPKTIPISLPSHSHPSPIPNKEESSEPYPAQAEKAERVM